MQPWNDNHQVGLIVYAPDGKNGHRVSWAKSLAPTSDDTIGWFACRAGADRTDLVQLRNIRGLLGISTFTPDGQGGYALKWYQTDVDRNGAAAAYWFKCKAADNTTNLLQIWNNNGSAAMILYAPGPNGYKTVWWNNDMGSLGALAWLTLETGGQTHIIKISDVSRRERTIRIDRYSPDKAGYVLASSVSCYDDSTPGGIWLGASFLKGTEDLVYLYNNNGVLGSVNYQWPLEFGTQSPWVIENMGIAPGNDPGARGWVTLRGDDATSMLVRFRNVNGNLGIVTFAPVLDGPVRYYKLAGRRDNLGVSADSIAFFGAEKEIV